MPTKRTGLTLLICVFSASLFAGTASAQQPIFFDGGPFYDAVLIDESFVKVKGTLNDTRVFNVVDPTLPLLRIIFQPNLVGGSNGGSVVLNGVKLFDSTAFKVDDSTRDTRINKEVPVLVGVNTLEVQIKGKGQGTLRIRILQPTSVAAGTIFVAPPAAGGSDFGACGPIATPCQTITFGIVRADATTGPQVLVANGVYVENPQLVPGIDVLGGFSTNFSTRDVQGTGTVIHGSGSSPTVFADLITSATLFEGFIVHGPTVTTAGGNSVAVSIVDSTSALQVQNNVIVAGVAGDEMSGGNGAPGAAGGNGAAGGDSEIGMATIPGGVGAAGTAGSGAGGAGGQSTPPLFDLQNGSGTDGLTSLGGSGGAGGASGGLGGGLACIYFLPGLGVDASPGLPGGPGINEQPGAGGLASSGSGLSGTWTSESGSDGTAGTPGSGGGGGGAGGGGEFGITTCDPDEVTGPSGGGSSPPPATIRPAAPSRCLGPTSQRLTAARGLRTAGFWTKIKRLRAPTGEQVRIGRRKLMHMRTIAPFILGILVAANFALGQSLAEVAEKEKERRKNNDQEATVVVKDMAVWLIPEEPKPESEDSAKPLGTENTKPRASKQEIEECRLAQDTLDDLKRDQRRLETRYLQLRRKAQTARILDTHGYRELQVDDWRVSRDEGREILGELTSIRAGLNDTHTKVDTYLQRI